MLSKLSCCCVYSCYGVWKPNSGSRSEHSQGIQRPRPLGNNDNNKGTTILETVSWAHVKPLQSITPLRAPNGPAYSRLSSIPVLTVELRKQLRETEGNVSVTSGDMSPSLNHYNNFSSVLLLFLLQAPCWEVLENVWSFQPGAHLVPITYRCGFKSQAVP